MSTTTARKTLPRPDLSGRPHWFTMQREMKASPAAIYRPGPSGSTPGLPRRA
jgi:hypothetical protein